ncbi:hypothetical protein ASG81_14295 [Paenibacillus sp. Soil522]|nr:hypothetical protein ASG81_14295 [Paenibacillus sp. Soil522]
MTSVRGVPVRSARKPLSLEPIKLTMPNMKRMTLSTPPLNDITEVRNGVIYVLTTEEIHHQWCGTSAACIANGQLIE